MGRPRVHGIEVSHGGVEVLPRISDDGVPPDRGLTEREAARRLIAYGPNELQAAHHRHPVRELGAQFVHPLALLLWAAAALSLITNAVALAVAIVLVIALNAGLAYVQELHSEKAVEALSAYLPQHAVVQRDGLRRVVPARELVPGDVILVDEGDRICADARIIDGAVSVDMSPLTGESVPVLRSTSAPGSGATGSSVTGSGAPGSRAAVDRPDRLFSGTACVAGNATAVVEKTGMHSEIGRIAALTQQVTRDPSRLELEVRRVAWLIAAVGCGAAVAFIPLGVLVAGLTWTDSANFAIGLIVANVPEGLLPTITLALAVAVRSMARKGALIKRLSAVEVLGSTGVICTDKTGTLTENQMAAVVVWSRDLEVDMRGGSTTGLRAGPVPRSIDLLSETLVRCNGAHGDHGDATEVALSLAAADLRPADGAPLNPADRIAVFGFDPVLRLMTTIDTETRGVVIHTKGAPEEVLTRCTDVVRADGSGIEPLTDAIRAELLAGVTAYAERGLRLIAAACRDLGDQPLPEARTAAECSLAWLGVVGLVDPARPEVADAITACHTAGIRVIVLTGDHRLTAGRLAHQVGIGGSSLLAVNAADLDALTEKDFDALLEQQPDMVIARSSPEMKMRVADALRSAGHVVAMTGDGVNDAPALRRADIGIAMGRSGTDVAREAATMILTDDNFSTIVAAVEAGRRVYDNVRKFILYIFAHATPEVVPFLIFALSGGAVPLPLTVIGILAIDIGTETFPALALGRERAEPGLMQQPPRPMSERLITGGLLLRAWLILGGTSAVLVVGAYFWTLIDGGWTPGADVTAASPLHAVYVQATTMTFLAIVACQIGTAFAARTHLASLRSIGLLTNPLLLWGIAFEVVFAAAVSALPGVSTALGMSLPPAQQLMVLPVFPLIVWGVDEGIRAVRRSRAA